MTKLRVARLSRAWPQSQLIDQIVELARLRNVHVAARPSLKTLLSRWENGHAVPDAGYRQLLGEIFAGEDLGFPHDGPAAGGLVGEEVRDGTSDTVLVPISVSGGIRYVPIKRRELLAAGLGTALGLALGEAGPLREQEDRLSTFSDAVARRLRYSRITVTDPALADLSVRLPDGDSFAGATVPMTLGPAGRAFDDHVVVDLQRDEAQRIVKAAQPSRIYVTSAHDRPGDFYLLGARAAVRQLRATRRSLRFPEAYLLDDVTLSILWGAATFDQPLLDDDALLARRQANPMYRGSAVAPEVADGLVADLSPVSRMWMGSEYCARYIVGNFKTLSAAPRFWTREQRGQEACTWLFFGHKFVYLLKAHERSGAGTRSTMSRSFCIPEETTHSSPVWERVLLFLSIALMESLGIEVHVCIEPKLSTVDGIVVAPGSQAVIANWVRASSAWVTDVTKDKSLLASYQDKIDFSVRASVNAGDDPRQRLQSLSAYLGLGWHQIGRRCCELAAYSPRGIYEPRSRLLSFAGLERALGFVESLHRRCGCQRQLASV
jgi:hypothetical protein